MYNSWSGRRGAVPRGAGSVRRVLDGPRAGPAAPGGRAGALPGAGCDATRPAERACWQAAQLPAYQATYDALKTAIFGMVLRPHAEATIREGLAALAPELGLNKHDSAVRIIRALRATTPTPLLTPRCGVGGPTARTTSTISCLDILSATKNKSP